MSEVLWIRVQLLILLLKKPNNKNNFTLDTGYPYCNKYSYLCNRNILSNERK
jgi:hypothetical protein